MDLNENIFKALGFGVAGVVWLVRLEGKVKQQEDKLEMQIRQLAVLQEKLENIDSKIVDELGRIRESLARLEGRLSAEE